jgi:hypothetical protein
MKMYTKHLFVTSIKKKKLWNCSQDFTKVYGLANKLNGILVSTIYQMVVINIILGKNRQKRISTWHGTKDPHLILQIEIIIWTCLNEEFGEIKVEKNKIKIQISLTCFPRATIT